MATGIYSVGSDPIPNSVQLAHGVMGIVGEQRFFRIAEEAGVGTDKCSMREVAQAVSSLCDAQYPPRGNR